MKKKLITISLLTALLLVFSACNGGNAEESSVSSGSEATATSEAVSDSVSSEDSDSSAPSSEINSEKERFSVTFAPISGVTYESETRSGSGVADGTTVSFRLKISSFYEGTPNVLSNGKTIHAEDGVYSVTVHEDIRISVGGIALKENQIVGSGTIANDPMALYTPQDLLLVAERVNAGDPSFIGAFYTLEADLDFGGETIEVIGDGRTEYSYFEGFFNGNGHTVSNYKIQTENTMYVGLFGFLQANVRNAQGGTIVNLTLKDFEIVARAKDGAIFCGSVVGFATGANVILCDAINGSIEIHGDLNNFTYTGGLVGFQQAYDFADATYLSSVAYCTSDVTVNCLEGANYCAGGITGYIAASIYKTTASINNCYSIGDVKGAVLSGGIVGYLGSDTSVVNCYATGTVSAQTPNSDLDNNEKYCHTYAGGLVGLADPDSIIASCFATGKVYAKAQIGVEYEHCGDLLGCASALPDGAYASAPAMLYRCVYSVDGTDVKNASYLKENLGWHETDWVFTSGEYPTINHTENASYVFDITIRFPGESDITVTDFDTYMPMSFWYREDILPNSLTGSNGDGHTSYGFFFDEALTQPIPNCFIPSYSMTVYVGVSDYSEVAGTYYVLLPGTTEPIRLVLNLDGTFSYTDGATVTESVYRYDGTRLVLQNARLARYSLLVPGILRYQLSDFLGVLEDGGIRILGGVFSDDDNTYTAYTEEYPLLAVPEQKALCGTYFVGDTVYTFRTDGTGEATTDGFVTDFTYVRDGRTVTLTVGGVDLVGEYSDGVLTLSGNIAGRADAYIGAWGTSSKANKVFTFDGAGHWMYEYYGYRTVQNGYSLTAEKTLIDLCCGSYKVLSDGSLQLFGELDGVVTLDDGILLVTLPNGSYECCRAGSFPGIWNYPDYNMTLYLYGIPANGVGKARAEYLYDNGMVEFYDMTYAFDNQNPYMLCLHYGTDIFGYLLYTPASDTLNATVYVGPLATYMQGVPLRRFDEYEGEWVSDHETVGQLTFNGLGSYNGGTVSIGGTVVRYTLTDGTLSGSFIYGHTVYTLTYDETVGGFMLFDGTASTPFCRKDAFGSMTLRDENGALYTFDGKGALSCFGRMKVQDTDGTTSTYRYSVSENGLLIYENDVLIGSLEKDATSKTYALTLSEKTHSLKIKSAFSGTWAMSGSMENLVIGELDLDQTASGSINGKVTVFRTEGDHMLFTYNDETYYIISVGKTDLVISERVDWYMTMDPIYCAPIDALFGIWKNELGFDCRFDGMSSSTLTSGSALTGDGSEYFYMKDDNGDYILWSSENGISTVMRVKFCSTGTLGAFINGDRAFITETADKLYGTSFTDPDSGIVYSFDGFGTVTTSDRRSYSYKLRSLDQNTGYGTVEITVDGTKVQAQLDFTITGNFLILF